MKRMSLFRYFSTTEYPEPLRAPRFEEVPLSPHVIHNEELSGVLIVGARSAALAAWGQLSPLRCRDMNGALLRCPKSGETGVRWTISPSAARAGSLVLLFISTVTY